METGSLRPEIRLAPPRVLLGWALAALGFGAGLLLASSLPSPAAPLLAWAGIAAGTLLAGSGLPVSLLSLLLGFELLRSLLRTGG